MLLYCHRHNNNTTRCKSVKLMLNTMCIKMLPNPARLFLNNMNKEAKKRITSFPSMPRCRACLWCHNKYIYSYGEELYPPLLHCNKRRRGETEPGRKASSASNICNILALLFRMFGEHPHSALMKTTAKQAPPTEPAPAWTRINQHRCQRVSLSQAILCCTSGRQRH